MKSFCPARQAAQTPLRGATMIFTFFREAKFQQPVYTACLFSHLLVTIYHPARLQI
jgi:hypothetical protein